MKHGLPSVLYRWGIKGSQIDVHMCVCVYFFFSVPKFLGSGTIQTQVCLLPEPRHFPLLVNSLNIHNIAEWKLWRWFYRWKPEGQRGVGPHPAGFQNSQKSSRLTTLRSGSDEDQAVSLGDKMAFCPCQSLLPNIHLTTEDSPVPLSPLIISFCVPNLAEVSCCLKPSSLQPPKLMFISTVQLTWLWVVITEWSISHSQVSSYNW